METKAEKIQHVAMRLIAQHGFKKVTMSDIAEASDMSRPTLYAAFPSKEAILVAVVEQQIATNRAAVEAKLPRIKSLEARLKLVFEVWIIEPFASVVDLPSGLDLIANATSYAPDACADLYEQFERLLESVLSPAASRKRPLGARDLAHILMLATKGLKTSSTSLAELQRLIDGLIAMAVASTEI